MCSTLGVNLKMFKCIKLPNEIFFKHNIFFSITQRKKQYVKQQQNDTENVATSTLYPTTKTPNC